MLYSAICIPGTLVTNSRYWS